MDDYQRIERAIKEKPTGKYFFYQESGEILFLYSATVGHGCKYSAYLFRHLSKEVDEGDYMGIPGLNQERGSLWYMLIFDVKDVAADVWRNIDQAMAAMENKTWKS